MKAAKLFHAVVITGAALTGCAGTVRTVAPQAAPQTGPALSKPDATNATTQPDDTANSGGTCPPGSERPYPPCYWIL